jgi:N-acetylneuraminic acid mutarotase
VVNDKLYIIGGRKQYANTATDAVIEYDPASRSCKRLNPLPYAVSGTETANWQNKILVVGGLNRKGNYLDSVIMYDVNTQRHHILPRMQKKRAYCTAVVVGNKLIVMGGADERSSRISSVESYDFQTYTWSDMAPMDEPRAYATAVVNYY